ncbi:anaphase-promoting complex subunit 11 [Limtongia smithiae]|uniref:anaphase-promoting complex subunit 11 n=1 Tax=Limtongia smithiae TaxID=1125753 RepID=UPI0034CD5768
MKVTINRWNAISTWHWDKLQDEVCGICRVAFEGTCPTCKYPGDDCPIIIGECQHAFHMHCLIKWLKTESSRELCPMCRRKFVFHSAS